jgi:hypothetical protein
MARGLGRGAWANGLYVLALAACVLALAPLGSQAPASAITGRVVDEHGAIMPGVIVATSGSGSSGRVLTMVTTSRGEFRAPGLPAGSYDIVFWLAGFATGQKHDVIVAADQVTNIGDIIMRVGKWTMSPNATRAVEFATSEGPFEIVLTGDPCEQATSSVCVGSPITIGLNLIFGLFLHAYDEGSVQPATREDAGASADALVVLPRNAADRLHGAVFLIGDVVALDPIGKEVVGQVVHRRDWDDTLAVIRRLPRRGSEFVKPVRVSRAQLLPPLGAPES